MPEARSALAPALCCLVIASALIFCGMLLWG